MKPFTFDAPLRTERITLRLFTADDVDDVHAYQSDEEVVRYMLYTPRTRETAAENLAKHALANTLEKDGDYLQLALDLDGRAIGESYFKLESVENQCGEIGWAMHPEFAGRGFALEAASAMLRVAFGELGLHRVIANLDPRNAASVALCLRLGMREEAHFIEDLAFKGDWADTGIYAILDREWAARVSG